MRLFSMSEADGRDSKNAMEGKCSPPSSVEGGEGGDRLQLTIVTSDDLSEVTTPPPKPTSRAKQPTSAIRRIVLREKLAIVSRVRESFLCGRMA